MVKPRTYSVIVARNRAGNSNTILEQWEDAKAPGKPHREWWYGPAVVERDLETGVVTYEAWCRYGKFHRDRNKPSEIWRDPYTAAIIQEGYGNGRLRKLLRKGPPGNKPFPAPHL